MKWRGRASRKVVEAVVGAFRDPAEESRQRLSRLTAGDWQRSYHWLDASGMALYFLDKVASLHIESELPGATLERLRGNLADNRRRSSALLAECTSLNETFQAAGLVYANLKGFTLSPDSCPKPELRCQLDLDFLVDGNQLDLGHKLLRQSGYELAAATADVWEFKAGASQLTSINDHYKPRAQRCVELHFASSAAPPHLPFRDPRLQRMINHSWHSWGGRAFPALAPADRFVAQALHIFKHLCTACTRVSWLLEFQQHMATRHDDLAFWNEVREQACAHRHGSIAIGLATLLSGRVFGGGAPAQLAQWTERLPASIRLWAEQYGTEAVLADFPGTKLYLLLQEELRINDQSWQHTRRSHLLPLHRAPRIVTVSVHDNVCTRMRSEVYQLRFILFRLRFHVVEGIRYLVEAARWKRRLADFRAGKPDLIVD